MPKKMIPRAKRVVNFYPWWNELFNTTTSMYDAPPELIYSTEYTLLGMAAAGNLNDNQSIRCWDLFQRRIAGLPDD